MRYLICRMHLVSAQGYLDIEYRNAQKLWRLHSNYMLVDFYNEVLQKYYDKVYTLRVDPRVQSAIGDKIQKNINKYQDHVHLITCGSEHISKNPLYNYINAPVGCFGIADEGSDMPGAEIRRVKPWKLLIRKVFRGCNS